jgi:peptide deformylase
VAIREILAIPHPILRQRARKVRRVDKRLLRLAHDMVETMRAAGGVGLAANQVGELRRLVVIQIPEEEEARIYINPEILKRGGEREIEEGCLSHAGYRAMVNRSEWIRFGALDHTEKVVKIKTDGLLSQAMEHEVDHLNGILYLDHLVEHSKPYLVDENGEPLDQEHEAGEEEAAPSSELLVPEEVPASLKIR